MVRFLPRSTIKSLNQTMRAPNATYPLQLSHAINPSRNHQLLQGIDTGKAT